jgi:hypothetical protein
MRTQTMKSEEDGGVSGDPLRAKCAQGAESKGIVLCRKRTAVPRCERSEQLEGNGVGGGEHEEF